MNIEKLLNQIRVEFPELERGDVFVPEQGWDHEVVILDGKWVFRFPRGHEDYLGRFPGEVKLMEYLAGKVGVEIPVYKYVARDFSFGGYEMVEGVAFTSEVFGDLGDEGKENVARGIGGFLTEIHSVDVEDVKKMGVEVQVQAKLHEEMLGAIEEHDLYGALNEEDGASVKGFLVEFGEMCEKAEWPMVFTHNDFDREHLLLSEGLDELVGVIDFSDRCVDDAAMDFGCLWEFCDVDFVEKVYEFYNGVKDDNFLWRSKMYCKRSNVWGLLDGLKGEHSTFEKEYENFKEYFFI